MQKAVIIIPTYNEKDNIEYLIDIILKQEKVIKFDVHILVVDDNSPDGTSEVVRKIMSRNEKVHLLTGEKKGLGNAYIRGFKYANDVLCADVVMQMDADLSHNPHDIPRIINMIDHENDFVIGSRYIKGGSIPSNWPQLRKLNSKVGNWVGKTITGIHGVNDVTGGFRAVKSKLIKRMPLRETGIKGYVIQLALLYYAQRLGGRIKEVPIHFSDRTKGSSKLRVKDILEFIWAAFMLRIKVFPQIVSWALITFLGLLLSGVLVLATVNSVQFAAISVVVSLSAVLIIQNFVNIYSLTYAWRDSDSVNENRSPKKFIKPQYSFTALVPARHEEKVIIDTIRAIDAIDYPEELKQTLVICRQDDEETIKKAEEVISKIGKSNISLVVFDGYPINKPHGLNRGLMRAENDIVVIFDAEDQPHSDIYNIANTVMVNEKVDVLQSGVQLINYNSQWFSSLNVLEYYFWFKSSLHLFSKLKAMTLGGNTVFFKREMLNEIGGWDQNCLTEDADIGIRLSAAGAKFKVVYDALHATREETPPSVRSFIGQRTRWNQGFLQILLKGDWLRLASFKQKVLAFYTLTLPHFLALQAIVVPFSILTAIYLKFPLIVALLSFAPLFLMGLQLVIYNLGFYEFTKDYRMPYSMLQPLKIAVKFYPYTLLLFLSAFRAVWRVIISENSWEKTLHLNEHRIGFNPNIINYKTVNENEA